MGYSGFALIFLVERGNITYIIIDNHNLSKRPENKDVIKPIASKLMQ